MVKCVDCGLLTSYDDEPNEVDRFKRSQGMHYPKCAIGQPEDPYKKYEKRTGYETGSVNSDFSLHVINQEHSCDKFLRYMPGYAPMQHLQDEDKWLDRWIQKDIGRKALILGVISLFLVLIATFVAPFLPYWTGWAR